MLNMSSPSMFSRSESQSEHRRERYRYRERGARKGEIGRGMQREWVR